VLFRETHSIEFEILKDIGSLIQIHFRVFLYKTFSTICMAKYFIGSIFIVFLLVSCKKEINNFSSESLTDYYPMQVGKYITYNLDSTLFTNFGQNQVIVHSQAQDRVDAQFTDNSGRPSFRILRFVRSDASQPWVPNNTFMVTPTENAIEYVENNLRFVKMRLPIKQDFSWKGNAFINTYSTINDVRYLDDWDYIYDSIGQPLTISTIKIDSTLKVAERDEFLGQNPSIPGTQYAEKTYSVEKYAKGIGLIYREFLHWEYQGPQNGAAGYYVGYGVKLSIIDHN
jgi:hypothetical protein